MVRLGDALRSATDADPLLSLVQLLPSRQGKGDRFICEFAVDSAARSGGSSKLETRLYAVSEAEAMAVSRQFLWIGNAPGPNSPQWTGTTNNVEYLLSQTIPTLCLKLPEDSNLRATLEAVRETCFYDLGPQSGQESRFRYLLDLERLGLLPEGAMERLLQRGSDSSGTHISAKSFLLRLEQEFFAATDIRKSSVVLWSLSVDGQRIVDHPDYRSLVMNQKVDAVFDGKEGRCATCARVSTVTADLTRMSFKYYNTDKISFASGVGGNRFDRNLALCRSCYAAALAAEAYVKANLRSRIGDLPCYVVPDYIGEWEGQGVIGDGSAIMRKIDQTINQQFDTVERFERSIEGARWESHGTVVNLLFFAWNNAELRILDLVRDVPISRFETLQLAFTKTRRIGERLVGESLSEFNDWKMDLYRMYELIPVAKAGDGGVDHRLLLQFLHSVISGRRVDYDFLVRAFAKLIIVHRFEQYVTTQVRKPPSGYELRSLTRDVVSANLVFYCLRRLGQLNHSPFEAWEEESNMNAERAEDGLDSSVAKHGQSGVRVQDDDRAGRFLDAMGYGRSQRGLFWLGFLMGKIAYVQRRGGIHSVPVLEKIDYRGMDESAVTKLIGRVIESARQNKLFDDRQGASTSRILYRMYEAFGAAWKHDASAVTWEPSGRVSKEEAVFYIMSGFAYQSQGYRWRQVEGDEVDAFGSGEGEGDDEMVDSAPYA